MASSSATPPVMLVVLDGWGARADADNNAVKLGHTPTYDRLIAQHPTAQLVAHGEAVGLPAGQMGNSEVGHLNLGAGRVVLQDLLRINKAVRDNALKDFAPLQDLIAKTKASGGRVHLMGCFSKGGVHAHQDHTAALANILSDAGLEVLLHAFTDGRDTAPMIAHDCLSDFQAAAPRARLASLIGRYYAMDRDKRWERVQRAYELIVHARGTPSGDFHVSVEQQHGEGRGDEFLEPLVAPEYQGFAPGDAILMTNYRKDRANQILEALLLADFDGFERSGPLPQAAAVVGMASYSAALDPIMGVLFPTEFVTDGLSETIAKAGLKQFHTAETEKFPHVTKFFNGGRQEPFDGEDRNLVPSPKVATYDLAPEMSAEGVTQGLIDAILSRDYAFLLVNYANPDMVGHTGDLQAAIKAVETVDACLGRVLDALAAQGGQALVTADHGNCETMVDPKTGKPHTAHTINPVTISLVGNDPATSVQLQDGSLCNVAPTILALMGLDQPSAMTAKSLLR